jgi:hypothetical protein
MTSTRSDETTILLHELTMVAEADEVTIGRPDIGSYAVFPAEGAQVIRMLDSGVPVSGVAEWYERTTGTSLDVADFLEALRDLQFLRSDGEERMGVAAVRWRRLSRWLFSWPAAAGYAALVGAAVVAMARTPQLRPSYRHLFFTEHLSLIPIVLTAALVPCILLHESAHALSGRRLGLPSTLTISRRLYYVVAETRLDSLLSVPRRQRYLPFLAGMLADIGLVATLTLLAAALRHDGIPAWCSAVCLAVAFTSILRLLWQFMFYLETDLYFVMTTALRCSDLQNATRFHLRCAFRRMLGRRPPPVPAEWSDRDRAMARRYAPLLVAGYGFSLGSLLWAGLPTTLRFWSELVERFHGSNTPAQALVDAVAFIGLTLLQPALLGYVVLRDRRARVATSLTEGAGT